MKLSEKIIALRSKHQMSQGDLAEKLNVSRQSVSKWETGASTPDLDKLIAMSELFQVTMDELTKENVELGNKEQSGEKETVVTPSVQEVAEKVAEGSRYIVIGLLLVLVSLISVVILVILGVPIRLPILILSYPFLCGLICLFSKKHAGRRILIMTLAIVVIGIILSVNSYTVGI